MALVDDPHDVAEGHAQDDSPPTKPVIRRPEPRWDTWSVTLYEGLAQLLEDGAARVDTWTGHDLWTFEPGSPAAVEVANTEVRRDGSPWGDRPVRTAYQLGQMATKFTVEMARCMAPLVLEARPAPGIEALTRTSLEAASVVWWLFELGLTARQRVCRMQLLRRNSAKELEAAIAAVGGDPSVGTQETVAAVEAYGNELRLQPFGQKGNELEGQVRPTYTARVRRFTDDVGYQGSYNLYSGVAHAELAGLWRLLRQTGTRPDGTPIYHAGPDPRATHSAVQGALKAMMGSMERIVFLFGWTAPGRSEDVGAWIDHNNEELARLKEW